MDLHWGYQLLVFHWHRMGGAVGLQILHAAALTGAMVLVIQQVRRRGGGAVGWLYVGLALLTAQERVLCRPELFTLVFLGLSWMVSERMIRGETVSWWWAVPAVVWANMQGLFVLGPAFMVLRGIGLVVDRWRRPESVAPTAVRAHLVAAAVMLAAAIVNPYGIDGLLLPFRLLTQVSGESVYAPILAELRSPFEGRVTPVLFVLTAVISLGVWIADRQRRVCDLLPMIAFGYLAFSARRNLLLFEFVTMIPTAISLCRLTDIPRARRVLLGSVGVALVVMILLVVTGRYYYEVRSTKEPGFGLSTHEYPAAATRRLENHALGGRLYNMLGDGDYLMWHLGPPWRILFDGRAEVYGERLGRELFLSYLLPEAFARIRDRYDIETILMDTSIPAGREFVATRVAEGGWWLDFFDGRGALLIRRKNALPGENGVPSDLVVDESRFRIPPARRLSPFAVRVSFPFAAARLGRMNLALSRPGAAAHGLLRAVHAFPHSPDLYSDLGATLLQVGAYETAWQAFRESLTLAPDQEEAVAGQARVLEAKGGPQDAIAWLTPWTSRRPDSEPIWLTLAAIQARAGDGPGAIRTLEGAYRRIPAALVPLAGLLARAGQTERAVTLLREYRVEHPGDPRARSLLDQLAGQRRETP